MLDTTLPSSSLGLDGAVEGILKNHPGAIRKPSKALSPEEVLKCRSIPYPDLTGVDSKKYPDAHND